MALDRQVHLYSIDTSCFYNDVEKQIGNKLNRLYALRNTVKNKQSKFKDTHLKRVNKLIIYYKNKLTDEFEHTRSQGGIRKIRENTLTENKIVSIFDSALTRSIGIKPDELTTDIMIIRVFFFQPAEDIIKHGFMYNNEKYVLFSASAGQIRTKKFVVIKETVLNRVKNKLMCGLDWDRINSKGGINANKYLAYYALCNSATDVWKEFDIDKSIVVDDFETLVEGQVDYIDDETYEITRKLMDVPIPHTDGCGIKLYGKNKMVRLPWFKGLMGTFRFDLFIQEMCVKYNRNDIGIVKDIYGKEYNIIADDIQFIFTKSQFKMWKYYESWDEYKTLFKIYQCEACECNVEDDYIKNAKINYQMLQTLTDITEKEMTKLAQDTITDIKNLGNDYRTMLKVLGVNDKSELNSMQQAIKIYPELLRDTYSRQILQDCKKSLVRQGRAGKISVKGKYTFVLPDLYAFCEWLFLGIENPQGILNKNEVSCKMYTNDIDVDCLRSPHLFKEHAIRHNIVNDNTIKWFDSKAIYTSIHDHISKVLQFDVDGDKLLVIADKNFCKIAKRNMNDIVPLYYNMKKAESQPLTYDILFDGLTHAYTGGNIGIYSNNISKIWNSGVIGKEQENTVKLLCMENNFVIDYAKTLYKPTRPKDVDDIIKKYTTAKLPHFFMYAKDKDRNQVEGVNNCAVNMLYKIIPEPRLNICKTIGRVETKRLLSDSNIVLDEKSKIIIKCYDYWNARKAYIIRNKKENREYDNEAYVYQTIKEHILRLPYNKSFIVDTLVKFLYDNRKSSDKKLLWKCFGNDIVENLKKNTADMGKICPICGKRFEQITNNQICCSKDCGRTLNVENQRKRDLQKS